MPDDTVARMIAGALAARGTDEPFHQTAARIFLLNLDDLTNAEKTAFEVTGFEAVKKDGAPAEIRVPSVIRLIEAGQSYHEAGIAPEERPRLMLLGFIALANEQALGGDAA